ncbi:putative ABC transporter G family member 10 [Iris pallida]|uniref:ABC transporter G family member 10 n=1 Tax=Iris pallida TaxID=29817 RepID=A0AAX6DVK5_IRIPA|nr:putative ABC transporter G family member 10 [Iris pallida]
MSRPRYRLDAVSLSYRSILRDVSCSAHPSELLAIVGPSGAGKTSLLSLLAAVSPSGPTSGRLLLNGVALNPAKFRRLSGHVTQEDALFPLLTVRESLTFSARLRLPLTPGEADVRVRTLLADLSLESVADSRIGALSGGERRRVSIGSDLVHHPQVLLLDEPTSGLDSASALHIISMLKSMAVNHGKTVILTIHQPGFRILDLVDRLLLISAGSVKHFGPLNLLEKRLSESGLSVPPHVNVLEFAMDKINTLTCTTTSTEQQQGEVVAVTKSSCSSSRELLERSGVSYANSRSSEILILTSRFFKNVMRTPQLSAARMLQCLFAGVALGTIFMNVDNLQARIGFFAFTLTFLLSSTTEGLPVFLQERRILARETSRGAYRVSSYVLSNALVFLPFLLLASLLYAAPVYWLVGLRRELGGFLYFSLVVWMVMATANSFVACLSALVPNFIMGNSLIAGLMGSFFLFSGYFISKRNIPKYWMFMHYMSLFKYPFEGFVVNEYGCGTGRSRCLDMEEGEVCVMDGATFLTQRGLVVSQKWTSLGVMMGFICGYRVLCFFILWVRCCRLRR